MLQRSKTGLEGGIAGWVRASIQQNRLVLIAVLVLVGAGVYGLVRMNKNEFPSFVIKQGLVAGIYPGATAAEVEEQLTKPLEEMLMAYEEVDRESLRSVTKDGICYIYTDLTCSQEKKDEVWSKIKLGLQTRRAQLPAGVLAVAVLDDFSSVTSMLIAIESDDKGYGELQAVAERLSERLRSLPALASVSILGAQQEEIAVTVDRERMSAYGLSPATLMVDYQTSALGIPAGTFNAGYTNAPIHVRSTVGSEREVAEKIVWSDPAGGVVRLKDIARVERRVAPPEQFVSYSGHTCLVLNIVMRPGNNIVRFGHDVDRLLDAFNADLPESIVMSRVSDQPRVVEDSVFSFLTDLVISMLVVIAVMLLLFPLKSALIASSGLPVITAVTLAVMFFTGMELNTVTLASLIVVLGMIVDDSIITMDGYMDKLGRGLGRVDAACASAKELFVPTFTATLAISLMFFPAKYIITGYLGDFIKLFPWVIAIALMMSIVYAVTVVPIFETHFIGEAASTHQNLISRMQHRLFRAIDTVYARAQAFCFRHAALTLGMGLVAVALGVWMFLHTNIQMMPLAARDHFVVEMEVQGGAGIGRTQQLADSLQRLMLKDARVVSCTAFTGTGAPRFNATYTPILPSSATAQIIVKTTSTQATEALLRKFEGHYEHIFPDALIRFKQMDYQAVGAPVEITLRGADREALVPAADSIRAYMMTLASELKWVHSDCADFRPAVEVTLRDDEASRLGVNKGMLSLALAGSFGGQPIATLWEGDTKVPVCLYSEGVGEGMDYETIGSQLIPTAMPGVSVPLRQVADVGPDWQPVQLGRFSSVPAVTIRADMKSGQSQPAVMKKVRQYIRQRVQPMLPEGAEVVYGGLSTMNRAVVPMIVLSFIAAVAVLFVFLLFHFRKVSVAVLTMAMSMLCLFGASFGLWVFRLDFGMTAVLGLISLVGIVVRNGILMYEYAEEQRFRHGVDVRTAAMEAGKRRMTPIFLTSCTTALGVLPMVVRGDLLWQPMGVVICFGTLLSIGLIVLIMPVSYWQLFKNAKGTQIPLTN